MYYILLQYEKFMKITVFGGSGFLGSHVADKLSFNKNKVTIFDKKKSKWIKDNQNFVLGDILDKAKDDGATSEKASEIASKLGVQRIYEDFKNSEDPFGDYYPHYSAEQIAADPDTFDQNKMAEAIKKSSPYVDQSWTGMEQDALININGTTFGSTYKRPADWMTGEDS